MIFQITSDYKRLATKYAKFLETLQVQYFSIVTGTFQPLYVVDMLGSVPVYTEWYDNEKNCREFTDTYWLGNLGNEAYSFKVTHAIL